MGRPSGASCDSGSGGSPVPHLHLLNRILQLPLLLLRKPGDALQRVVHRSNYIAHAHDQYRRARANAAVTLSTLHPPVAS